MKEKRKEKLPLSAPFWDLHFLLLVVVVFAWVQDVPAVGPQQVAVVGNLARLQGMPYDGWQLLGILEGLAWPTP